MKKVSSNISALTEASVESSKVRGVPPPPKNGENLKAVFPILHIDYLAISEKKGELLINGESVETPVLLEHGDQLETRKMRMRYHTEILLGG